jgi:hypothetical protein
LDEMRGCGVDWRMVGVLEADRKIRLYELAGPVSTGRAGSADHSDHDPA